MRLAMVGALITVGLLLAIASAQNVGESVYGAPAASTHQPPELIAHFAPSSNGSQMVAIIDPERRVLSVYQVDGSTGSITLKSVRNLSWDLQMIQFNSDSPSPQDVRGGLKQ